MLKSMGVAGRLRSHPPQWAVRVDLVTTQKVALSFILGGAARPSQNQAGLRPWRFPWCCPSFFGGCMMKLLSPMELQISVANLYMTIIAMNHAKNQAENLKYAHLTQKLTECIPREQHKALNTMLGDWFQKAVLYESGDVRE
jgi:hypothetical protein